MIPAIETATCEAPMVANVKSSAPPVMPKHVTPMLAVLSDVPPDTAKYGYEFKWDGVRAVTYIMRQKMRMVSRNDLEMQARYPEFHALANLREPMILDGEIVALGGGETRGIAGRPDFARLQRRMHVSADRVTPALVRDYPAAYFVFDLLWWRGKSTMNLPYRQRRQLLERDAGLLFAKAG